MKIQTSTSLMHIPRGSKIYLNEGNTIEGDDFHLNSDEAYIHFGRLDGMYSYCTIMSMDGKRDYGIMHLNVGTPLEQYKDGYRLIKEKDDESN